MKTELYKMWIEFCTHRAFKVENLQQCKSSRCEISFYTANKNNRWFIVEWMSPEYKAWNAWKNVRWRSKTIIEFVVENWNILKKHFPATCITLEMLNLDISCLLEKDVYYKSSIIEMIKRALSTDVGSRKTSSVRCLNHLI